MRGGEEERGGEREREEEICCVPRFDENQVPKVPGFRPKTRHFYLREEERKERRRVGRERKMERGGRGKRRGRYERGGHYDNNFDSNPRDQCERVS